MLILGPKMCHITHFGYNKSFFQKMLSATFICLLNPDFMQKIKKSNEPILIKRCYRQLDRDTDGQTETV